MKSSLSPFTLPALTFAAGHRGISLFELEQKFDMRTKFAVGKPWPVDRVNYEWRHNDLYLVAYPYINLMYDKWNELIKGKVPQQ